MTYKDKTVQKLKHQEKYYLFFFRYFIAVHERVSYENDSILTSFILKLILLHIKEFVNTDNLKIIKTCKNYC